MARRKKQGGNEAAIVVMWIVFSIVGFIVANWIAIVSVIAVIAILWIWRSIAKHKAEEKAARDWRDHLQEKYKSEPVVTKILNRQIWIGETTEQLIDSLGVPDDIDTAATKRIHRETWKFNEFRQGQFKLRIQVDNGKVAAWTDKR